MAEISYPFSGTITGDAGPYSDATWSDRWRKLFTNDRTDEGVLPNYTNELEITGATSPVSVNTGAAFCDGKFYENDSATSVTIPSPAVSTRIDRIVLRKSWVAQTVRLTRIEGIEGGGVPALTQNDGTTWDVPLYQVSIAVGGGIALTDERVFIHPNIEIEGAMLSTSLFPPIVLYPDKTAYAPLSGVQAAGIEVNESSSGATEKPLLPQINFDDTTDEGRMFVFRLPQSYSGIPVIHGLYKMAGANVAKVADLNIQIAAVSDGDVSWSAKAFDAGNSSIFTVNATADVAESFSITVTNADSMVAGDWICLLIWLDVSDSDFAGDLQLMNLELRHI